MIKQDENNACSGRKLLASADKPAARHCHVRDCDVTAPIMHGRRLFRIASSQAGSFKRIAHGRREPV